MSEVVGLARPSAWHSPKATPTRCLYCGQGPACFLEDGCGCFRAREARAGKRQAPVVMLRTICPECQKRAQRRHLGDLVDCRGCGAAFEPQDVQTVIFLDPEASAWVHAGRPEEGKSRSLTVEEMAVLNQSVVETLQVASDTGSEDGQNPPTEGDSGAETPQVADNPPDPAPQIDVEGIRERRRRLILEQIALGKSDSRIARELGVDRQTVRAARARRDGQD